MRETTTQQERKRAIETIAVCSAVSQFETKLSNCLLTIWGISHFDKYHVEETHRADQRIEGQLLKGGNVDLSQRPDLVQQQTLHLTTELRQGLAVLQLNAANLADYVNACIEENPVFTDVSQEDADTSEVEGWQDGKARDARNENTAFSTADSNRTIYSGMDGHTPRVSTDAIMERRGHGSPETFDAERRDMSQRSFSIDRFLEARETVTEHVMSQLRMQTNDVRIHAIGGFISGNLDGSGYLTMTVAEIAEVLGVDEDEVEEVLELIQGLQPLGLAARNLAECLRPQLEASGLMTPLLDKLLSNHLSDLERKSVASVAHDMGVSPEDLERELQSIRCCNPRPGSQFDTTSDPIWPEAVIEREPDGTYSVRLNDLYLPELKVDERYRTLASSVKDKATADYLMEKIREAEGLIEGVAYRNATLYKITCSIAEMQTEFFDEGFDRLRPLTMAKIAETAGVSQSTVSRIANGNYVQTPRGTFELRFFFHGATRADGAVEVSSLSVKRRIREIIEAENPAKPLSDQAISTELQAEGIEISRRTVAKYRDQLGIPVKAARKRK